MATKIIKAGADVYRATCGECGCRFTYERDDVRTNYVGVVREVVTCPHCGEQVSHHGYRGDEWPRPAREDCL